MRAEILKAVENNQKIVVAASIFTSYFNESSKKTKYWMNHEYIEYKCAEFNSEKEYVKAIMQRVNYYIRRGYPHLIEIDGQRITK